jgi:hypothetical protein
MPTLARLRSEPWWDREVVTAELDWLGDELCRRTGRPRFAFGTKGDEAHLRGAHRSQEWLERSRYCTNRTYTRQSGLTAAQLRHVAGIDFTPGSDVQMVAQCKRLDSALRAGRLEEVREFYGNVNGDRVVDGWDNIRNRAATSDSSHLWHWHLTLDRRRCADRALMERILRIVLGDEGEDDDMTPDDVRAEVRRGVHGLLDEAATRSTATGRQVADDLAAIIDGRLAVGLAPVLTNLAVLSGRDWVDEQQIVDGVLSGLGGKDLDEAAEALRAALGADRAAELGALLVATGGMAGTGSA